MQGRDFTPPCSAPLALALPPQSLANQIGARRYVECSALTRTGIVEAVEKAISEVLPDVKEGAQTDASNFSRDDLCGFPRLMAGCSWLCTLR